MHIVHPEFLHPHLARPTPLFTPHTTHLTLTPHTLNFTLTLYTFVGLRNVEKLVNFSQPGLGGEQTSASQEECQPARKQFQRGRTQRVGARLAHCAS